MKFYNFKPEQQVIWRRGFRKQRRNGRRTSYSIMLGNFIRRWGEGPFPVVEIVCHERSILIDGKLRTIVEPVGSGQGLHDQLVKIQVCNDGPVLERTALLSGMFLEHAPAPKRKERGIPRRRKSLRSS